MRKRETSPPDYGADNNGASVVSGDRAYAQIVSELREIGKSLAMRDATPSRDRIQDFISAATRLAEAHSSAPSDSAAVLGRYAALAMRRFHEIDIGLRLEGKGSERRLPFALFGDRGNPLPPIDYTIHEIDDAEADAGGASSERGRSMFLSAIFGRVHKTHDELAAEAPPAEPWAFPELFMGLARRVYGDQAPERKIVGAKTGGRIIDGILANVKRWQRGALGEPGQR